jgi:hypothetical protein
MAAQARVAAIDVSAKSTPAVRNSSEYVLQ